MSSFKMSLNLDDLNAEFGALEADVEASARPVAQAGAQVLYEQVQVNVNAIGKVTGNFSRAVYQAFADKESGQGRAVYNISWNARKAPHGHLIEDGFIQKYKVYLGKDGKWYTNKKAPLPAPVQRAAKAPVRRASSAIPAAEAAMEAKFFELMGAA